MKVRKMLFASAMAFMLAFSSFLVVPAFAVSFEDTEGLESESSIAKLVSLGIITNPGGSFNPEGTLSRTDFAYMVKGVIGDAQSKDVSNGKGNVTYLELAKVLSRALGLKATWTNDPASFLFYLDRKGVLDIDTDLDAVVTREAAAVAFDKYMTVKGIYKTDSGVLLNVSDDSLKINNGIEDATYKLSKNVSVFVSGQGVETQNLAVGMPVDVVFSSKGEVAFVVGHLLDAEEGTVALQNGKFMINDNIAKDINPNALFVSLPTSQNDVFNLSLFVQYAGAGAQLSGQVMFPDTNEVSLATLYISKAEKKSIKFEGNKINVTFSATLQQKFDVSADVKVTLDEQESTVDAVKALDPSKFTATIEANAAGEITSITAVTSK